MRVLSQNQGTGHRKLKGGQKTCLHTRHWKGCRLEDVELPGLNWGGGEERSERPQ